MAPYEAQSEHVNVNLDDSYIKPSKLLKALTLLLQVLGLPDLVE